MGFVLTTIGFLLLLSSLAAVCFGVFMAMDPKTRDAGRFFAVWWVPAAAAATGVLMRDVVTFAVGTLCFLVAGVVFTLQGGIQRRPTARRTRQETSGRSKNNENRAAS